MGHSVVRDKTEQKKRVIIGLVFHYSLLGPVRQRDRFDRTLAYNLTLQINHRLISHESFLRFHSCHFRHPSTHSFAPGKSKSSLPQTIFITDCVHRPDCLCGFSDLSGFLLLWFQFSVLISCGIDRPVGFWATITLRITLCYRIALHHRMFYTVF